MVASTGGSRNPPWEFDELVLALDLYRRRGLLGKAEPEVVELSQLLNGLPIHPGDGRAEDFRNPSGVALKLANFAALDPNYEGKGMNRGSRRDAEVWDRFLDHPEELAGAASTIRALGPSVPNVGVIDADDEEGVVEGRILVRAHRLRERDSGIVRQKKEQAAQGGSLGCEACGFDFEATYGELGSGFAECHHIVPLAEAGVSKTRIDDLALLCSNCHRMIHRRRPWLTIPELSELVAGHQGRYLGG